MPHIVFDGPILTKEQKKEIVEKFTEIASEVTKIPREVFIVMIKENDPDNVGVGGKLLSEMMQRES